MSQATTLARPYARAMFLSAKQEDRLKDALEALAFSAHTIAEPMVATLLGDPRIDRDQLLDLISHPDADDSMRRFLAVLAENGRLALLPEISALFEQLRAEDGRIRRATITSATPLSDVELQSLLQALKKRFGSEVEVRTSVDPDLIGGAVIDAGDVVIDGSIRNKLSRLNASLAN